MKTTLIIKNLKCNGCATTITNKLSELKTISNIKVDVATSQVSFNYETEVAVLEAKNILKRNGYPEIGEENPLGTKAKSFVSCAMGKL
jgi:copper chaperone CopZ